MENESNPQRPPLPSNDEVPSRVGPAPAAESEDPLDRYARDPTMPSFADPECRRYADTRRAERERKEKLTSSSVDPARRTSAVAFRGEEPDAGDPLLDFTPVPHVAPRRNSITAERQRAFIAELAACGIVRQAARKIGASIEALYRLRNRPGAEGFAAAWEEALDRGIARLEDCALERALRGEERPIVSRGKIVGSWRKHDNSLLMFLLRQRRDSRYTAGAAQELRPGSKAWNKAKQQWQREGMEEARKAKMSLTDMMVDFERRTRARIRAEIEKEFAEREAQRRPAAPALPAPDAKEDTGTGEAADARPTSSETSEGGTAIPRGPRVYFL